MPKGALAYLHTVTEAGQKELMQHKAIALILNTGVAEALEQCHASGKPFIYGGNGHGPAFIERTADLQQANIIEIVADTGLVAGGNANMMPNGTPTSAVPFALSSAIRYCFDRL